LDRYGKTGGFYRKVGDVAGMDVVAVPMDRADAALFADVTSDLLWLATLLILLFATILVAFRMVVPRSPLGSRKNGSTSGSAG
jgi:hypothetical protein